MVDMERATIKVYKHEARSPKELLDAIIFASKTMGIHRIINLSGRRLLVGFTLEERAISVSIDYGTETISSTIYSSPNMILDIHGAHIVTHDYENFSLKKMYTGIGLLNGQEIIIFRWRATGMRQIMYVFRGGEEYERVMTLIDLWKLRTQ